MDKNSKSRTEYSAINSSVAITARIIAILLGYAARVVFTHTLNEDYVGINGLFGNILNILSISELGMGTAITFALYKPVAEGDKEKQKSLMLLYKRFYYLVALFVTAAGLCVIPFMDILIKNKPEVDHLILIYILFLLNTVLSYVGIYKRTLIDAHQKNYISVSIQTGSWALSAILQIVFLTLTRNFFAYLIIMITCTLISNILITYKANKMYPYLKEKNTLKLPKDEKDNIAKNIKAMLLHKIGEVVVNNTDNLLISSLVSTVAVGIYSNYFLVIGSVNQVLTQMFQGIAASVGNLGVLEGKERIKKIYESTFFLAQWIFGICFICMFQILDGFVGFSFGSQYVFTKDITLILCINFYILGMRQPTLVFRDSMGLFWYDRYKSVAEAVINLAVSIILGRLYGVLGIFLGTLISCVATSLWIEPFVFYKYRLKENSFKFFARFLIYMLVTAGLFLSENMLCARIPMEGLPGGIVKSLICFAITNIAYLILYSHTKEFKFLWKKGLSILNKRKIKDSEKEELSPKAEILIKAVNAAFDEKADEEFVISKECPEKGIDEEEFIDYARKHSVLPFLYDLCEADENLKEEIKASVTKEARGIVEKNYRYLYEGKSIIDTLRDSQIEACILKGSATASFYPVPELRKSSDIDVLITEKDNLEKAVEILVSKGFIVEEKQLALHHVVLRHENVVAELHSMLAEPFDDRRINTYIEERLPECANQIVLRECMGIKVPMLDDAYHAYELLLHMLQHFLREGFGLKLLCDWALFFDRDISDEMKEKYLKLVNESGIKGFSDIVTKACVKYLSLDEKKVGWMNISDDTDADSFMADVMNAGDFGKMENDRMVVLRGKGFSDYVREFHHQMHLNFPKAGKVFVIWPVLWTATYIKFVNNNKKVRGGISGRQLYRKAAKRSELVKNMNLFETKGDKSNE